MQSDTFLDILTDLSNHPEVNRSYLAFRSGHWLRVTLAMNLKRQTELGHPSADSLWDYNGMIANCFSDLGIKVRLYQSSKRNTLARRTKARGSRDFYKDIVLFEDMRNPLDLKDKTGLITHPDGYFTQMSQIDSFEIYDILPLGPIALEILEIEPKHNIPWDSLMYWGWTFERGEEPTEVIGKGGYSAVSGWKAYARWMQGYLLKPKKKGIHPYLKTLPSILFDRVNSASPYLEKIIEEESKVPLRENFEAFYEVIQKVKPLLTELDDLYRNNSSHSEIRKGITSVYFTFQETLPIFKSLKNLHHDYILQSKH